jgi:hypothetical protein
MNSITADELKHISISASQTKRNRLCGTKKAGQYLIDQYKKKELVFQRSESFTKVPATSLNKKSREKLNDSENICLHRRLRET